AAYAFKNAPAFLSNHLGSNSAVRIESSLTHWQNLL
ncbi:MAG: hypothetical protein ACI8XX_001852, partial [Polaribacter sp.]